ncbi:LysR family transcriptional regulator [Kushneria aurantia]|uniref:LysR family transcriptional regulator n=1 Tax=Kushneria aurantia TaxID=504092 RepID=A0ABV6G3U5_9GAMM|nr:LysR family transcriptional regulator [Kushneria aurantia]
MSHRPLAASRTLDLEALSCFVAICETGTFRLAAVRVHKSPSAVSLQIGKLEQRLGVRILDRNARRVVLTEAGELLLEQARRLLNLSEETLGLFHQAPLSGRICLAAPHDLGISLVPTLLRRLADRYPDLYVDVRLMASERIRESFTAGDVQLALFNDVGRSTLASRELFSEPLTWLMCREGRAVGQSPLPLAAAEVGCAWRDVALDALQRAQRRYRIAYSSDTSMGQLAALRADLAVAALPLSLTGRALVEVPAACGLPPLPMTHIRLADDGSELARIVRSFVMSDSTCCEQQYRPDVASTMT